MCRSRMQVYAARIFPIAFISILAVAVSSALSPDRRLLALVPPGSQVVAGIAASHVGGQPDSFLLITHNNAVDLQDFFALTGSDASRSIHQVIFTAAADRASDLTEHSLLASGHFDRAKIFRSAGGKGANLSQYRGIPVLVVSPFERERGTFYDMRGLVVIDSDVVLFGTLITVQQELDRHMDRSPSDSSIVERLSRMRGDDETWCLLATSGHGDEIQNALRQLDPTLAGMVENGGAFQFGIRYGVHIEFEYEISAASLANAQDVSESLAISLGGAIPNASSFFREPGINKNVDVIHGVVKVSRQRYEAWLAGLSANMLHGSVFLHLEK